MENEEGYMGPFFLSPVVLFSAGDNKQIECRMISGYP
jgi:hypothetical protein